MKKGKINIEKYIERFETGLISVEEIAMVEEKSEGVIYREIKKYYTEREIPLPKILTSPYLIKEYMKKGLTRKQIEEIAYKKNLIIADIYYKRAEEALKREQTENEIGD